MSAKADGYDTIRRAIHLAEAEARLGLPRREGIRNKLSAKAYARTRDRLDREDAKRGA